MDTGLFTEICEGVMERVERAKICSLLLRSVYVLIFACTSSPTLFLDPAPYSI